MIGDVKFRLHKFVGECRIAKETVSQCHGLQASQRVLRHFGAAEEYALDPSCVMATVQPLLTSPTTLTLAPLVASGVRNALCLHAVRSAMHVPSLCR